MSKKQHPYQKIALPAAQVRKTMAHHNDKQKISYDKHGSKTGQNLNHEMLTQKTVIRRPVTGDRTTKSKNSGKPEPLLNGDDKDHSFQTTMHHVRSSLNPVQRQFSRFIHNHRIENVSESLAKTIARPSAVNGAALVSMIGLVIIYPVATFAGFKLSGSEMPLLLLVGYFGGLLLEWIIKSSHSIFKA